METQTSPVRFEDLQPGDRIVVEYGDGRRPHVRVVGSVFFGREHKGRGEEGQWSVEYDHRDGGGWDLQEVINSVLRPASVVPSEPPKTAPKPAVWYRLTDDTIRLDPEQMVLWRNRNEPDLFYRCTKERVLYDTENHLDHRERCEFMIVPGSSADR